MKKTTMDLADVPVPQIGKTVICLLYENNPQLFYTFGFEDIEYTFKHKYGTFVVVDCGVSYTLQINSPDEKGEIKKVNSPFLIAATIEGVFSGRVSQFGRQRSFSKKKTDELIQKLVSSKS